MEPGDVGAFFLGLTAVGLGAPFLLEAFIARPPPRLPAPAVWMAGGWAVVMLTAAVLALVLLDRFVEFGVLLAAAEVMAAAAIWVRRGRRGSDGDDGGDDGDAPTPDVPPHYWHVWEQSLRDRVGRH